MVFFMVRLLLVFCGCGGALQPGAAMRRARPRLRMLGGMYDVFVSGRRAAAFGGSKLSTS
jgi:hypothetical protein